LARLFDGLAVKRKVSNSQASEILPTKDKSTAREAAEHTLDRF
jgi:hypothetical protein